MKEILDITYKTVNGKDLMLDMFLPDEAQNAPLIFWIHGGAWMMGDRKWCGLQEQTRRGYAVVSVDYRLSDEAIFPACIVDCKDALHFLRKNAAQYPIDFNRVCVAGDSAGGHLAALMGVSAGHADWEPAGADCRVQAVIDFYGPTHLGRHHWPGTEDNESISRQLLGESTRTRKGMILLAAANPLTYIDGDEPPFFIYHGDMDDLVPIEQSYMLRNELEKRGVKVIMHTAFGVGHTMEMLTPAVSALIGEFLDAHLK